MKKCFVSLVSLWFSFLGSMVSAQVVTDVKAVQRYPWNNLVDISYTIQGVSDEAAYALQVKAVDQEAGVSIQSLALDQKPSVANGRHVMTWNPARDGIAEMISSNMVYTVSLCKIPLYLVVDLSDGPSANTYPVSYLDAEPAGGWTDEYKTTKLVLRRIPAGSFQMGSPEGEVGREEGDWERQHPVTLTRDYYMGVFEVTQKQWELVGVPWVQSSNSGDTRPIDLMCYKAIRGSKKGKQWPASSEVDAGTFLGRIRERTGIRVFDLPTEAQWEYACRAGTSTSLNSNKDLTSAYDTCPNLNEVGRYYQNITDGKGGYGSHTAVGSYLPNAWGLYDMHGNVAECCLDWFGPYEGDGIDPRGAASSDEDLRVIRGGHWSEYGNLCISAARGRDYSSQGFVYYGFRLCATPTLQSPDAPAPAPDDQGPAGGPDARAYVLCSRASSAASSLEIGGQPRFLEPGRTVKIAYSDGWDGTSGNSVSIVANGTELFSGMGSGFYSWKAPASAARVLMTHTDGSEVLNAEIIVPGELGLTIDSAEEGVYPAPGAHRYEIGSVVTSAVPGMVQISENERRVCTGWTGTGSVPANGEGTNIVFTLYEKSTLQWNWDTQFKIQVSAKGEGTVSPASGWYSASAPATFTAAPVGENRLERWTGDVDGCTTNGLSITFTPDRPRTIVAEFVFDSFLRDIVARSRYPWENLIDIDYSIGSLNDPESYELRIVAEDLDTGRIIPVIALVRAPPLTRGTHRVSWDPVRDGAVFTSKRMVFHASLYKVPLYQVVDLTGAAPEDARVSYLDAIPGGAWGDEHKTDKLVLRRIRGGEFKMGAYPMEQGADRAMESRHTVRLTKSYYIGVFEITQKQYQWLTGNSPALNPGEKRPVENVSLEDIRGATDQYLDPRSTRVAPDSFLGKLRLLSGIQTFDLPSEARWEYACRAGMESSFNNGVLVVSGIPYPGAVIGDIARYQNTRNDGKCEYPVNADRTVGVGCYSPNAWGLYDMHGNVREWCLDIYAPYSDEWLDPTGLNGNTYSARSNRINRGGHYADPNGHCRSAARHCKEPWERDDCHGFRVISDSVSEASPCELAASSAPSAITVDSQEVHTVLAGAKVDIAYSDRWFPGTSAMQIPTGSAEIAVEGEGTFVWTAPSTPGFLQMTFTHTFQGGIFPMTATFQVVEPLRTVVRSHYPWSHLVDIEYTVAGIAVPSDYALSIEAEDLRTGKRYPVRALDPAPSLENGTHRVVWDPMSDSVTAPVDQMAFRLSLSRQPLYVVIDLEKDGPDAVSGLDEIPAGGWSQEYKSTKMVFRKILPGEFDMGEGEGLRHVRMTKAYYMAIFEMTQRQWDLLSGGEKNPATYKGPTRPMENISYEQLRGQNEGAKWPSSDAVDADSFIGIFRNKTGLDTIDLPTGAQWEYACRAGTQTPLNNGTYPSSWGPDPNMDPIGRYNGNNKSNVGGYSDNHTEVGSYQPNAWGIYDMHGNVTEWVRDWHSNDIAGGTDPVGPQTGDSRELRGGGWHLPSHGCLATSRYASVPSKHCDADGFRLSIGQVPGQLDRFMTTETVTVSPDVSSLDIPIGKELPINYSDRWDGTPGGEITIKILDGETLFIGSGEGIIRWRPSRPGTFTLLYREGKLAIAREVTVTGTLLETVTTPVPVPYIWLDQTGLVQDGDYEAAALADGVNGRPVWESYVLGLDPTDPASRFLALIEMVDGQAVITWQPDLGQERSYTVEGKESLDDPAWEPRKGNHRFFRVRVELPQ